MKLLRWIFSLTYCEYDGKHYVLDCGPIGLSVVGEVAIIYMEDFQMKSKSEAFPELNDWPWYVDDSVLKSNDKKADEILNHLNSVDPEHIKFTMEKEENNKLASLDLAMNVNRRTKKVEFNVIIYIIIIYTFPCLGNRLMAQSHEITALFKTLRRGNTVLSQCCPLCTVLHQLVPLRFLDICLLQGLVQPTTICESGASQRTLISHP